MILHAFFVKIRLIKRKNTQILLSMKLLRKLLSIIFFLFLAFSIFAIAYYFSVTSHVQLSHDKLLLAHQNVIVYDAFGKNMDAFSFDGKQTVQIGDIPLHTRAAFVNVEDKRFYTHKGFDVRRIVKAAMKNVKSRSFREGASTISQQLIKNTHLTQEKTINRKLKEWKLTKALERTYSKDEILEKYLNVVYFGHNCFGLRAAARFYFGKTPSELDLADSAILAGLLRSPNNYSPFKNAENCKKRKAVVLQIMFNNGSITETQLNNALQKPLPTAPTESKEHLGYLHFVFNELTDIAEEIHLTTSGKIEIFTYFQPKAQTALETATQSHTKSDVTAAVLDVQAHAFKACVSTAGAIPRLPGSLLKPLLVYAPALQENLLSPATPILDEKINYGGYSPDNYDGQFHGYVSARDALAHSYNVPAVKVLESLGLSKATRYLAEMGLPVQTQDTSLALALGGMRNGFAFQDILSAYSTFANDGEYVCGRFIKKIQIDGNVLYTRECTPKRVFSSSTAYLTTDMLKTAAKTGTAKKLRTLPFDIAAKTGTAGTEKGNSDAYAVSYTTRDCIGVWLGNASGALIDDTGGGLPCNYLLQINQLLQKDYAAQAQEILPFSKPQDVVQVTLDSISYYDTHTLLLADDFAPAKFQLHELFALHAVPLRKSSIFSNPSIPLPTVKYKNGKVEIYFLGEQTLPYGYRISRYDYATHTTVYDGNALPVFIDDSVEKNKRYVYTITPYFQGIDGTPIKLPEINTQSNLSEKDDDMLQKDWWTE